MLEVPLRIPDVVLETIPEETGFTMSEKIALRNAWNLIADNVDQYAQDLFLDFFTENDQALENFRRSNGEFNMDRLHSHPISIFLTLQLMIFEGLESTMQMHGILSWVAVGHFKRKVQNEIIQKMLEALATFLKTVLKRVLSPTLETSIDKICRVIMMVHTELEIK